jgi:hypothetical protein
LPIVSASPSVPDTPIRLERTGVVVLGNAAGLLDERLDVPELGDGDAGEVHDGAGRVDDEAVGAHGGADGEAVAEEALVLDDEALDLPLGRRDGVELLDVDLAELLDVDRPAVLRPSPSGARRKAAEGLALSVLW